MDFVGIGAGARCVCDRYEDETWFGEKPRTTLWEVMSSALVSDPTVCLELCSLPGLLSGAVDEEDSEDRRGACIEGDAGRGVMSVEGMSVGTALAMDGESGSIFFCSLIESTICSSRNEEIGFSRPLLTPLADSVQRRGDDRKLTGAVRKE